MSEIREPMKRKDFLFLSLFCLLLFCFPLINNRVFTTHETVHCQNVREMMQDGDWIIPHYGGRVWMERPPLPFWITAGFVHVFGDNPSAYRLAPMAMGIWCVLLVGWMAATLYGRNIGLTSGLVLATMNEFNHYSTGPEADMFLCAIVTSAMAFFVYLEFRRWPAPSESVRFFGFRPWPVFAFFLVLGLTNVAKGLFFGTIFVCLPIAAFLLWNADVRALRRYLWLPGWLGYLVVGSAWAVAAYLQYPGALDFWKNDYGSRVNQGYMQEPLWYYFAHFFLVAFPWPLLIIWGFAATATKALKDKASVERFLWCWGLVPIVFFSIPQGKHHHYLLQTMAPWAVLGAIGAKRFWEWVGKRWSPVNSCSYVRGVSFACLILVAFYWASYALRTAYWNRYREDSAFIAATSNLVPESRSILVMDDDAPLNASWLLFYLPGRTTLLHNITFLKCADLADKDCYLITRKKQEPVLSHLGYFELVWQSRHSRYESSPLDRYGLYHLHFRDDLERVPGPIAINPLQATGREPGPFLH